MSFEVSCETCNDLVDLLAGRIEAIYRGVVVSHVLYHIMLCVAILVGLLFAAWFIREGYLAMKGKGSSVDEDEADNI